MTIEKAAITLTKAIENRYLPLCKELDDATKLGIEALKALKKYRECHSVIAFEDDDPLFGLLGETYIPESIGKLPSDEE